MSGAKWALLVGIDYYPAGDTPRLDTEGRCIEYNNLSGCVRDILEVELFLLETMKVEPSHIIRLLAPVPQDEELSKYANGDKSKPTYKNITDALDSIIELAKPEDLVYIHYSGHGARATTIFPNLKSGTKWDEAFVPTDIASGGQYLRDLELGLFLKRMVQEKLIVTVVLDCCHSGGGVRNAGRGTAREVKGYYNSILPNDLPITFGEIERNRSLILREPEGFTLFAACLPEERAREVLFDDSRVHGVFTYCLLQTLRHGLSQTPSSRTLYQRVCGRVRDEFVDQTPFFAGETDRLFFGTDVIAQAHTITVQRISPFPNVEEELDLAGGASHGVHVGSEYAVYPFGRTSGTGSMRVEVKEVHSLKSVATIVELNDETVGKIEPGCPAVLLKLPFKEKLHITFSSAETVIVEKFARDWNTHGGNNGWLQLVIDTKISNSSSPFCVTLNGKGEYVIEDTYGTPIPNITPPLPPLPGEEPWAIPRLIGRLRHLSQFHAVKKIDNPDGTSPLRGSLLLEISKGPGLPSIQYSEAGAEYRIRNKEKIYLCLRNHGTETVYFALFNLEPLFGISQVFPRRADYEPLEAGQLFIIPIKMSIPPELAQPGSQSVSILDILKVFVTLEPASFRSLVLPDIKKAELSGFRGGKENQNGLQQLLCNLAKPRRNATYDEEDIRDWQVMEVRVRTG